MIGSSRLMRSWNVTHGSLSKSGRCGRCCDAEPGAIQDAVVRQDKSTQLKGDWSGGGPVMAPRRLASTQSFNQKCFCVR